MGAGQKWLLRAGLLILVTSVAGWLLGDWVWTVMVALVLSGCVVALCRWANAPAVAAPDEPAAVPGRPEQ